MPEEVIIRVDEVVPIYNDRADFSHVPGLWQSIKRHGLMQAITVNRLTTPEPKSITVLPGTSHEKTIASKGIYGLVAGESRWQAHVLGEAETIRAIVAGERTAESLWLTLIENIARKDLTIIEEAAAFKKRMDGGATVAEIAQSTGKREDYIQRRLNVLKLRPELQKLISDGQMPLTYATILMELDNNRQLIAVRKIMEVRKDGYAPTVEVVKAQIVGPLLEQQNQAGLFGLFDFGGGQQTRMEVEAPKVPPEPTTFKPTARGKTPAAAIRSTLDEWQALERRWSGFGDHNKAKACAVMVQQLTDLLAVVEGLPQPTGESLTDKVVRLLSQRGSMSTRELTQYANAASSDLREALDTLTGGGHIHRHPSGRGYRYTLAKKELVLA